MDAAAKVKGQGHTSTNTEHYTYLSSDFNWLQSVVLGGCQITELDMRRLVIDVINDDTGVT